MQPELPPCGFYRTTVSVVGIPEKRLVYFHNHGQPGPGVYLPSGWRNNVASFAAQGQTLTDAELIRTLHPLPAQGLYRVAQSFHCCARKCRQFDENMLVQLGYNGAGEPILFVPELSDAGMLFPQSGSAVEESELPKMTLLRVQRPAEQPGAKTSAIIH